MKIFSNDLGNYYVVYNNNNVYFPDNEPDKYCFIDSKPMDGDYSILDTRIIDSQLNWRQAPRRIIRGSEYPPKSKYENHNILKTFTVLNGEVIK